MGGPSTTPRAIRSWAALAAMVLLGLGCAGARDDAPPPPSPDRVARLDELSALWSFYQFRYVEGGRVVSLDEDRITTSEGQGVESL